MNKGILTLIAAAMVIALVVAGCGSDDGTTTASISKAQFLKEGNAICTAGNEEINSEFEKFAKENKLTQNKEPTDAQFEEAAEDFLLPSVSRQIEEVRALGAPEGEEDAVNAFLDSAEAEVEKIENDPSLISGNVFVGVNKEAKALGLTACAEE